MVNKEEFTKYLDELLSNDKDKIKLISKKYLFLSLALIAVGIFVLISQILFFIEWHIFVFTRKLFVGVLCFVCGLITLIVRSKNKKYFRVNYREKVISYLLKDYSHCFIEEGWPMSWELDNSQFVRKYDLCSTSDCLIVNIPNDDGSESKVDLKICDLYAYNVHRDEEGNVSHSKVYKGMFAAVEFPRKFKCFLSIDVNYKRAGLKLEKVELEDINFNRKFKVKSNDQIESRYILTPEVMGELFNLEKKFKNLKVVFANRCLYIGCPDIDLFELNAFKEDSSFSAFEDLYEEINSIIKIVEQIKRNNKVFKMERKKRVSKNKEDK